MLNPKNKFYRWGPIDGCPLFMNFCIEPAFAPLKQLFGSAYSESVIYFEKGRVTWLLDEEELISESEKFLNNTILNQFEYALYLKEWSKRSENLLSTFDKLDLIDLSTRTNDALILLFNDFTEQYMNWFTVAISHELATTSLEHMISTQLKKYFEPNEIEKFQEAFAIATAPDSLTFYRQEQLDLMKIATLSADEQKRALTEHQKNYYWMFNSYAEGKVLDLNFFQDELNKLTGSDFRQEQSEIETYEEKIKQQKKDLLSTFKLSVEDSKLVTIITTFANLLDKRKELNFKADHYIELFVAEFARRTDYSNDDIRYLLSQEIESIFNINFVIVISQRKEAFVLRCNGEKIEQLAGSEAFEIIQTFNSPLQAVNKVISGTVASMGTTRHFRGTARIISSIREIDKVKQGEILVTMMTSPDFVIGMKRAGAIVTDTGGMLCHAAIVSRELGIPCIVGTEYATQMIADGDVVELHCVNGSVRIVGQN